jgi:hypothetical protein
MRRYFLRIALRDRRMSRRLPARFLFATLALAATLARAEVRDGDPALGVDHGQAAQRRGAETLHPAHVDRRRFEAMGRGASLDLPSTGAAPQHARFVRGEHRGGDFTWIGKVDTDAGEQAVVITFGEDATFGTLPQQHGPPIRVEGKHGRAWLVEGENRRRMAAGSRSDARIPPAGGTTTAGDAPTAAATTTSTTSTGTPVIDVLVAYTPSMVTRYGSTSAVLTRLTYLESLTNQAYADTPANVRIRVVARLQLNYTAATDNGTVLDLITNPSTNAVKTQIDAWRQQYGADLVSVVRAFDSAVMDDCGQGWIGGYHGSAFTASRGFTALADGEDGGYYCVDQTFAHELGHNMGSHHDIDTAGGDYGAYSYSRGYRQTLSATSGFATIMAYSDGPQTQLNRFSNPALAACMNRACGVAGSSDNARTLNNTAAIVAAFRGATSTTATPTLAVANASMAEGNSGTRALTFRVKLSAASTTSVSFTAATANGTATAGSDYTALPATRYTIAAGATTRDIAVTINGDTAVEANETLTLSLTNPSGATLADGSATGTITNDDGNALLSIADVAIDEGQSGTKVATFTVKLSQPAPTTVGYDITTLTTSTTTATAGSDFVAKTLHQAIAAGATSQAFPVTINGDTTAEGNETYIVSVTNVTGATAADGAALGTIRNDDLPRITIADVAVNEGNSGTTAAVFTVTLSSPATAPVSFDIATLATATTTATPGTDYTATALTGASIPVGSRTRTFSVPIRGDTSVEPNEVFVVSVTRPVGAVLADGAALGTIRNDD